MYYMVFWSGFQTLFVIRNQMQTAFFAKKKPICMTNGCLFFVSAALKDNKTGQGDGRMPNAKQAYISPTTRENSVNGLVVAWCASV